MIILTGNNLGERQRDLNNRVNKAASSNVDFEKVKETAEKSDVDKLFKIDLASKYMNIEYIIEVLKSGDSLYVSRALKCAWIYDDEFSNIINVDNLHNNVIPFMSAKMKKKLLTTISVHVRNEDRAAAFYKYCVDIKLTNIALKFLNFTSDNFKLEVLKDSSNCRLLYNFEAENLKGFIGLSFTLAEAYVALFGKNNRLQVFRSLSYLYSVSNVKYLDMLEKSVMLDSYNQIRLGIRLSKSIMKNHKNRVLKHPSLYVQILNKIILTRYSSAEDAKTYLNAVLPEEATQFWHMNYCSAYAFLIDKIPEENKFLFMKTIFTGKYPGEEFEMDIKFYNMQYYTLMTAEERHDWALKQIASGAENLGIGKDYIWYKFVSFEKAFEEIKKLVMITTDNSKRAEMVNILVESAKNQRDVEKLLNHYNKRHINEKKYIKENFLDRVIQHFNVYEFDADCWTALNKIFHSLEVYSMTDCHYYKSDYKIIALIYNIINKKDIHEAIKLYIRTNMYFYSLKLNTDKLPKEQQEMVFHYLFEFYMDEIRKHENVPYDDDVKHHLRKYIYFILDLLDQYDRTKNDCPELVEKFMKLDWSEYKFHRLINKKADVKGELDLMRYLKKDTKGLVKALPLVKQKIDTDYIIYKISHVLKKLKIYFSEDIAKDFLKFFDELLTEDNFWHKTAQSAAHGIFQLGDEAFKVDFMKKYAPTEPKINHSDINEKLLLIQRAICAHVCYSRPPLPLKYILMYIKGDYVQFCLPIFPSYLANLPLPLCMEFIEAILNTPVSIQKHGIRLAFECFNADTLNKLVLHAWSKTKNISLRKVIFKVIFNKILEDNNAHEVLFNTLKTITMTLHQDDDDELFRLLTSNNFPKHLKQEYIEIAWSVVNKFALKPSNINRKEAIVRYLDNNIHLMRQSVVGNIVEEFITSVFSLQNKGDTSYLNQDDTDLIDAKWSLITNYITYVQSKEDLGIKLELTKSILSKCLVPLETEISNKKYVLRQLCYNFILQLNKKSFVQNFKCYENVNTIMQYILDTLQDTLPIEEIYNVVWEIRLGIATRNVITTAKIKYENKVLTDDDNEAINEIASNFAQATGNIIKNFVEKEIYFASFSRDITSLFNNAIIQLDCEVNIRAERKDLLTSVAHELTKFGMSEIYLVVLDLLPLMPPYNEDFKSVINIIKKLDNKEVRCNFYKKYINDDFEVREFMLSDN